MTDDDPIPTIPYARPVAPIRRAWHPMKTVAIVGLIVAGVGLLCNGCGVMLGERFAPPVTPMVTTPTIEGGDLSASDQDDVVAALAERGALTAEDCERLAVALPHLLLPINPNATGSPADQVVSQLTPHSYGLFTVGHSNVRVDHRGVYSEIYPRPSGSRTYTTVSDTGRVTRDATTAPNKQDVITRAWFGRVSAVLHMLLAVWLLMASIRTLTDAAAGTFWLVVWAFLKITIGLATSAAGVVMLYRTIEERHYTETTLAGTVLVDKVTYEGTQMGTIVGASLVPVLVSLLLPAAILIVAGVVRQRDNAERVA